MFSTTQEPASHAPEECYGTGTLTLPSNQPPVAWNQPTYPPGYAIMMPYSAPQPRYQLSSPNTAPYALQPQQHMPYVHAPQSEPYKAPTQAVMYAPATSVYPQNTYPYFYVQPQHNAAHRTASLPTQQTCQLDALAAPTEQATTCSLPDQINTSELGLFNDKEEKVVGWWLNELGQPADAQADQAVYSAPLASDSYVPSKSKSSSFESSTEDAPSHEQQPEIPAAETQQDSLDAEVESTSSSVSGGKRDKRYKQSDDQKRSNHLASERRRRANYKSAILNLSRMIPRGSGTESQSCLIWKAVNFIRSLEQTNHLLRARLHEYLGPY